MDRSARRLLSAGQRVFGGLDVATVLRQVLESAQELTGARYAALGVLGEPNDVEQGVGEFAQFIAVGVDEAAIGVPPRGRGVLGELIRDPRPLRLANVGQHPRSFGFPHGHPAMHTFLGVPVMAHGAPFGNLYLAEKHSGDLFDANDEETAVMLAEFAGIAVEKALLHDELKSQCEDLERSVSALEVTTQISRAVGDETDLATILQLVAKRGRALVGARALVIELQQDQELIVAAGAGELPERLLGRRVALKGTVAEHALGTLCTQTLSDELNRDRFNEHGLGGLGMHADGGLIVPLVFKGRSYGVLLAVDRLE